jgi:hypothetical protein
LASEDSFTVKFFSFAATNFFFYGKTISDHKKRELMAYVADGASRLCAQVNDFLYVGKTIFLLPTFFPSYGL